MARQDAGELRAKRARSEKSLTSGDHDLRQTLTYDGDYHDQHRAYVADSPAQCTPSNGHVADQSLRYEDPYAFVPLSSDRPLKMASSDDDFMARFDQGHKTVW